MPSNCKTLRKAERACETIRFRKTGERYLSVNSPALKLLLLKLTLTLTQTLTLNLTLTLSLSLTLALTLTLAVNSGAGELYSNELPLHQLVKDMGKAML